VVKPLRKHIKGINAYAGATILGDGRVALILDVLGLAQRANVVRESRDAAVAEKEGTPASAIGERSGHTVLLFQNGERERMAIELSQVARLEEFSREAIEIVGGREVVQYRGQIMPLLHLSQFFGALGSAESDSLRPVQVVVYSEGGHKVGLIVDRILDIIEDAFQIQPDTGRSGVLGSAVIQKRTTEILDIRSLVASVAQS